MSYKNKTTWKDDKGNVFVMKRVGKGIMEFRINDVSITIPWQKFYKRLYQMGATEA